MKNIFLVLFVVSMTLTLSAQTPSRDGRQKEKIEDIIGDLSSQQKTRIDAITQRSSKTIDKYRSQLDAVRDSIRMFMENQGDNSSRLFPLYDREGRLKAELNKEYYRTKVAIDAVLTPEQQKMLREKMESKKQKNRARDVKSKTRGKQR